MLPVKGDLNLGPFNLEPSALTIAPPCFGLPHHICCPILTPQLYSFREKLCSNETNGCFKNYEAFLKLFRHIENITNYRVFGKKQCVSDLRSFYAFL